MVSKASEDLPDPDSPVITTRRSRGMSTSIFLRLWTRAPRTAIQSCAIPYYRVFRGRSKPPFYHAGTGRPLPAEDLRDAGGGHAGFGQDGRRVGPERGHRSRRPRVRETASRD